MSIALEALEAEVLRLAPAERARLLDRLISSLDADADTDAAWDDVAAMREQELSSGAVTAVPLDAVIARLEARFYR